MNKALQFTSRAKSCVNICCWQNKLACICSQYVKAMLEDSQSDRCMMYEEVSERVMVARAGLKLQRTFLRWSKKEID